MPMRLRLLRVLVFGLTAIAFSQVAPVKAASQNAPTIPQEYQGVLAAAQDCKQNIQNVLPHVVNRGYATCRVIQVLSSGHPGWHTDTINLNCAGSRSREIWHDENIDGTDFLVTVEFDHGEEVGRPSISIYKRCPDIPLGAIPGRTRGGR